MVHPDVSGVKNARGAYYVRFSLLVFRFSLTNRFYTTSECLQK